MATYKVIQDIEAEDKLLGPFSFRQFVYFLIAAFFGYLSFIFIAKHVGFMAIVTVPPALFCLFFAWPWSPDQPTEVWALAHIRFYFKNRKRVWDQSGLKEFVTVTVPKKIERAYTDGLSQAEVRSRLQALSQTIDSRGWAVKNAFVNESPVVVSPNATDRLVDFNAMPQEVSNLDIRAEDDILDEQNNPMAYHMTEMIDASTKARRHDLLERLRSQGASTPQIEAPVPQWFQRQAPPQPITGQAQQVASAGLPQVAPQNYAAQADDAMQLPPAPPSPTSHLKTIDPNEGNQQKQAPQTMPIPQPAAAPVAPQAAPTPPAATQDIADPAILNLAHDNNLDVATLAREAKRAKGDTSDDEVVISLH